jgi:hypothetical protein
MTSEIFLSPDRIIPLGFAAFVLVLVLLFNGSKRNQ